MLNAIDNNHIKFKNVYEKDNIVDQLKSSLEILNESPKIKIGFYSKQNDSNEVKEITNKINDHSLTPKHDEVTFGRGRKHFKVHPCMQSNISLTFKNNFANPKERIDQLIDYYIDSSKKEKSYNYSPSLYSLYNKEKVDPTVKYSDRIRHQNVSNGNLQCI